MNIRQRILLLLASRDCKGEEIVYELEAPRENVYAELVAMEAKKEVVFVKRNPPRPSVWVSMVETA